MQPNQQTPINPNNTIDQRAADKRRKKRALIWLIGPTALGLGALLLFVLINFLFGDSTGIVKTVINIFLYLVCLIVVATWLPGIIIGIVLLSSRKTS